MHKHTIIHISALLIICLLGGSAAGLDRVTLMRDGQRIEVEGRVEVEARDGGLMLLARDGVIWTVQPDELVERTSDDAPFEPMSRDELSRRTLAELPPGFDVYRTANYMIFYDTSKGYAQWCGSLFERLYRQFENYWSRKGFSPVKPKLPLVAVVFADKQSYVKFAEAELGDAAGSIIGYYSFRSNRMVMYDLTGLGSSNRTGRGASSMSGINKLLSQPAAAQTTATIVHEATHQIAFNRGLHARYSDCPLWFIEGIAVFFETPDLRNSKGWRTIGAVNRPRLARFREYQRRRPKDSLHKLISDDSRFRKTDTSLDAYAETWALTYFLLRQRSQQYVEYLKMLSQKKPLIWDSPESRIEQFERIFGDLDKLDAEFLRSMGKVD